MFIFVPVEECVNSETKHTPFLKPRRFFSHERSRNLNKKLSQRRKAGGEVGNRAKVNFRATRVLGQLRRECLRYSTIFRRRDSRKAVVEICSLNYEGRTREMERIPDPRCFLDFLSQVAMLLFPLILVISVSISRRSISNLPNVISPPRNVSYKSKICAVWNTRKSSFENNTTRGK